MEQEMLGQIQTARPDLPLRFVNDAHLNHTMAYLTACTFYAALFDRSPEGVPVDTITDIRVLDDAHKDKDRDGGPIAHTFSAKDRADLQRIAQMLVGALAFEVGGHPRPVRGLPAAQKTLGAAQRQPAFARRIAASACPAAIPDEGKEVAANGSHAVRRA